MKQYQKRAEELFDYLGRQRENVSKEEWIDFISVELEVAHLKGRREALKETIKGIDKYKFIKQK